MAAAASDDLDEIQEAIAALSKDTGDIADKLDVQALALEDVQECLVGLREQIAAAASGGGGVVVDTQSTLPLTFLLCHVLLLHMIYPSLNPALPSAHTMLTF